MRLLIAVSNPSLAKGVRDALYAGSELGEIVLAENVDTAQRALHGERWELALVDEPFLGLLQRPPLCPPRVLCLLEEGRPRRGIRADCFAPASAGPDRLARLLLLLSKKPLPALAAAHWERMDGAVERFLDAMVMNRDWKGRAYLRWLLLRYVPSPLTEALPMGDAYAACARAHGTTPAAVERCLRVAIEGVFTLGSMAAIERYFGATVDPERGKPTNRAFLLQAAKQLRLLLDGVPLGEQKRDAP